MEKGLGTGFQASRDLLIEMPLTQEGAAFKSALDNEAWSFTQDLYYRHIESRGLHPHR